MKANAGNRRYALCHLTLLPALACGLLLGGCGVALPPPTGALSQAELAVMQASSSGAAEQEQAALRLAREKLENAKQAMAAKDYLTAGRLAEQALVDAQAAEAQARTQSAKQAAIEMRTSIDLLRQNLEHPPEQTN